MFNYDPLSGEEEEDLIYPEDEQLAVMMDYYDEIETLAAQIVAKKFPGKSLITRKQGCKRDLKWKN